MSSPSPAERSIEDYYPDRPRRATPMVPGDGNDCLSPCGNAMSRKDNAMTSTGFRLSTAHLPGAPTSPDELDAMRRRAWLEQGIVMIRPEELGDVWLRQAIVQEAVRRHGERG